MNDLNVDIAALANGIILFAAVVGGVGVIWRVMVLPGLKRVINAAIAPIVAQFVINGGESLKDATNRIEVKLDQVDQKIQQHVAWSAGVMARNDLTDPGDPGIT